MFTNAVRASMKGRGSKTPPRKYKDEAEEDRREFGYEKSKKTREKRRNRLNKRDMWEGWDG